MIDKLKQIMADIFEVSLEQTDEIRYGQHKNWDSMRHFLLILALEDLWEVEIDEKDSSKLKSLEEIVHYFDSGFNL